MDTDKRFAGKLTDADARRLQRVGGRRGRASPAKVPARLARTSAFAPKRRGLITDSKFRRLYVVPGHSIVKVAGRELGSQHRDALYAVFRLAHAETVMNDPKSPIGKSRVLVVNTSWRELLTTLGLSPHLNNVATLHLVFEEIKQVVVTVYDTRSGSEEKRLVEAFHKGTLHDAPGRMGNLLNDVDWSGLGLDDTVRILYGDWTANMIVTAKLVSLNADVQFALASDYAKTFWPYIDSFSNHTWIDEERLAILAGRDLWGEGETRFTRSEFRKACRKAFDDMVRVGGLRSWHDETRGDGRQKSRRYHYVHGLDKAQLELPIAQSEIVLAEE
jgi:hypothetical protein